MRVATQIAGKPSATGCSFHNFAVLSLLPVARINAAVGLNATEVTASVCPVRVATQIADKPSATGCSPHNFAVLSQLPVARRRPVECDGWNATEATASRCPVRVATHPVVFHNFAVPSELPVARINAAVGLNATELTLPVCPSKVAIGDIAPESASGNSGDISPESGFANTYSLVVRFWPNTQPAGRSGGCLLLLMRISPIWMSGWCDALGLMSLIGSSRTSNASLW